MIAPLGHLITVVALVAALAGAAASFWAGAKEDTWFLAWGRRAAFSVFGLVAASVALMLFALISHDFSVRYVADVGSRETPLYYTIISLWGALEGSILWWAFLLSLYTVAFLFIVRDRFAELQPFITGILLTISAFFLFVISGPGNPFAKVTPAPADGAGPNPLLQNHWMMGVHPPLLYLGYVGLSIPYAIAVGSLLKGSPGPEAFRLIRRWALIPWIFLTLGIAAGMWWSYAVLGWGGYWAWDPVENVAVMPWLVTTAFLHSLQVQERRQMLKTWTLSLIIAAFLLSILGTFLTRGGVLASVHSFTQSAIGPVFLTFLGFVLIVSLGLIFARSKELAAPGALESAVCRESAFLFNNLLFVAITFTILLGTLFPLIAEALQGTQLSVGAPYFNHVAVPIGFALLFLMGIGPALPWGAGRLDDLQYRFLGPVAVGVGVILVLLVVGVRGVGALITFGAVGFVLTVTIGRIVGDIRSRQASRSETRSTAMRRLFSANPRRYGGYLAHIGVLLVLVGIAASQSYQVRTTATLHPGQSLSVDGYTVTYRALQPHAQSNRMVLAAEVTATHGRQNLGQFFPSQNYFRQVSQPVVTPAVREEPWGMLSGLLQGKNPFNDVGQLAQGKNPFEDLYLVLVAVNAQNASQHLSNRTITLQAMVNPLVGLIWLGGMVAGLGGFFALIPARRRRTVTALAAEPIRMHSEEATA